MPPPILLLPTDIKDLVCMCTTLKTNFGAKIHRLCWNHKSNQDSASVNKAASHPCRQRQWPLDEPLALSITPLWHPLSAVTDEKSRNDMNHDEGNKDFCLNYFKCKFDVYIFQICSSSGALTKAIKRNWIWKVLFQNNNIKTSLSSLWPSMSYKKPIVQR